jgi:hypothetical protein
VKSAITKRSIVIGGRKTSVGLEDQFWNALKEISGVREVALTGFFSAELRAAFKPFRTWRDSACPTQTSCRSCVAVFHE